MLYSDFSLTVIALGWVLPISSKGQLLKVTLLFLKGATKKFPYAYARKLIRFSLVDQKSSFQHVVFFLMSFALFGDFSPLRCKA